MLARLGIFLLALGLSASVIAQSVDDRLLRISERLEMANSAYADGLGLTLAELTTLATELEDILREIRQLDRDFDVQREEAEIAFFEQAADLREVLGFLVTLQAQPASEFLLHPEGPVAAMRANLIIEQSLPGIEARLVDIATKLSGWQEIERREERLQTSAATALTEINQLREDIVEYERSDNPKRQVDEPMVLDAIFAVSDNLSDFVTGMSTLAISGDLPKSYDFDANAGTIPLPVLGTPQEYREGIQIATQDTFVKTPFPATVRFAAQFLDYGQLVLLEPQKDVIVVLAGMDQITVVEGDIIDAGQIVGYFSNTTNQDQDTTRNKLRETAKSLYVETRIKTVPVKALDYFIAREQ